MVFHTAALLIKGLGLRCVEWARRQRQTVEAKGLWNVANTPTVTCLILNGLPHWRLIRRRQKAERESLEGIMSQAAVWFVGETIRKE